MKPFRFSRLVLMTALAVLWAMPSQAALSDEKKESIRAFVLAYVNDVTGGDGTAEKTFFASAEVPDTNMSIVFLSGRGWCGSGGCIMLVLKESGQSYDLVNRITVSRPPVIALTTKSHGAPDIGVTVSGGGVSGSYVAALPFNGTKYAGNPTAAPARRADNITGTILINGEDDVVPLIPQNR